METPLDGYKTYIVAAVGIAIVLLLYYRGDMGGTDVLETVLTLLGISGVRHRIERG